MMKSIFFPVLTIAILACNDQSGSTNTTGTVAIAAPAPAGDCGNSLVFRKVAELRGSVYDGAVPASCAPPDLYGGIEWQDAVCHRIL